MNLKTGTATLSILIAMALLSSADAGPRISGVTLFMAPWCTYCMQAKAYMAKHDIKYREFDVDTAAGQKAFENTGGTRGVPAGKRGIPFLLWKGEQIRGFSAASYDEFFDLSD
jgi:glutaredoxin